MTATTESRLSLPGTVILIPAYNEGAAIAEVVAEVRQYCDCPLVVIDDASTDDTAERAREAGARVIPLVSQLGAWGAMQTGLRYATRNGFSLAVTMDADGQHEATSLGALAAPVTRGDADVAIGACTRRGSRMRKIAWLLMKRVSGLTLEDITSGFRVYNKRAIGELVRRRATLLDYQDVGVLLLLQSRGLRVVDVEVNMRDRIHGASRVFSSWLVVSFYMCNTLLLGLTKRRLARAWRPSPTTAHRGA